MPFRNYATIFQEIKKSRFVRTQSLVLFIITYIDWTILPFVTKLEGTYLPVYMISIFMLIGALDGFIQPLFKNIRIYRIYLFSILLDIVQMSSYMFYSVSIPVFTYIILSIFTVQGITFEIARVHTVDFMQEEDVELKDYLMIRSFIISGAIIAGGFSSILLDYFKTDMKILLIYLSVLGVVGIFFQYKLYKKFKHKSLNSAVEIEKDRKEIYEKIRS
ncbi:hypothetical protein [Sulfurimonas sp. HSL-1716]|uniref:hypothetical protein n=1 Tax=Hydrocurvibacter sulfurireducens TaxID=3131937 RepID=UPI0031F82BF2